MMEARLTTVEYLLGVTSHIADTRSGLADSIASGLPVSVINHLADEMAPNDMHFKFRLIPKVTLDRRRKSASRRLTNEEIDRLSRIAKVFSFAMGMYRDRVKVREFLERPHMMLDGKLPLDVALDTPPGAETVINLLGRAVFGGSS